MTEVTMQREFFGYLTLIDDFDEQIERYWDKKEKRIASWYLAQKRPDDLIISASPNCVIDPIAKRLGVRCMAADFGREYGVFLNKMKYAKEKPATSLTRASRRSRIPNPIPSRIRRWPCWLKRRIWSPIRPAS